VRNRNRWPGNRHRPSFGPSVPRNHRRTYLDPWNRASEPWCRNHAGGPVGSL